MTTTFWNLKCLSKSVCLKLLQPVHIANSIIFLSCITWKVPPLFQYIHFIWWEKRVVLDLKCDYLVINFLEKWDQRSKFGWIPCLDDVDVKKSPNCAFIITLLIRMFLCFFSKWRLVYVVLQGSRHTGLDIKGKNVSNPMSLLFASTLMLEHLG